MDAVGCPSPCLPPHPWQLSHHHRHRQQQTLPRSRYPELYLVSRSCNIIHRRHRTGALNNMFIAAATSPDAPRDASVLIPISALLLSVYWFANFFMPGIIAKDFEKNGSFDEETPTAGAEISDEEEVSKPRKPILKVKNGKVIRATSNNR